MWNNTVYKGTLPEVLFALIVRKKFPSVNFYTLAPLLMLWTNIRYACPSRWSVGKIFSKSTQWSVIHHNDELQGRVGVKWAADHAFRCSSRSAWVGTIHACIQSSEVKCPFWEKSHAASSYSSSQVGCSKDPKLFMMQFRTFQWSQEWLHACTERWFMLHQAVAAV